MPKRKLIKITLQQGESLSRKNFADRTCLIVTQGNFVIFNSKGEVVLSLSAGEADVENEHYEFTGTATEDDTEVIIV